MNEFLTVLAWIFGILYTAKLLWYIGLWVNVFITFDEYQLRLLGYHMQKDGRSFGVFIPFVISIICWTWIIVH